MALSLVSTEATPAPKRRAPDPGLKPAVIALERAVPFTGRSRSTLYRLAADGEITLIKCGRSTMLDLASWDAYVARLPRLVLQRKANAA